MKKLNVYAELDVLLDTRMGIINRVSHKYADALKNNPKYFKRTDDKFDRILPNFPQKKFESLYETRCYKQIRGAVLKTGLANAIANYYRAWAVENVVDPDMVEMILTVNTFPYSIPAREAEDIRGVLSEFMGISNVKLISMMPAIVTPGFIKANFVKVHMYDFDGWINIHHKELASVPMPTIEIIHPLIIKKDNGLKISEVVSETKRIFAHLINLITIPLDHFSMKVD